MVTIEDKINLFSKIIYGEVDDKINSELDELENVEKDTIEKEEREVKKYRNKNIQSVEKKIKSKFEKEVFKLKLEEQQQLLNLKENMINETLESLKERIIDFTKSDEYINYIKSHLDNTLKDIENKESIIIYFNKKDLEKFKKVINKDNVEVSNESKDIIGGYIIQDKNNKFRVDCSLEISIEECKEKNRNKYNRVIHVDKGVVLLDSLVGTIVGINGPVIKAEGMSKFKMREMVMVGKKKLIGEIIILENDLATIQVYEETSGLKIGENISSTGMPLSLKLGPGIIGNMFDGIQRPLKKINEISYGFIDEGIGLISIDEEKEWDVNIVVKVGDKLKPGDVYAEVQETNIIKHRIMVPQDVNGEVIKVKESGKYNIEEKIVSVKDGGNIYELNLYQRWPVRAPRPIKNRLSLGKPLITGQRILDMFFPIAKGGTVAIPGGFGTGKTMTQHQLAKWSDADIIVYIGCGERGNEMTEVLEDFPKLIDPKTNTSLMNRTVLIANTSNMPVAAREASIYTGITIAEYYRDMGYDVAIMADSTSRWAEALREISGRLEEMPAEEGYPAYLPSRIAEFYERAGYVENLNDTEGSVTVIGAVSPAGADFSEPVTQNTKRFVGAFLGLDRKLAYARHYPAINWLTSYSQYNVMLTDWYLENISEDIIELRNKMLKILFEENKLQEIVKLVGEDVLPDDQRLILEVARILKVGFLQQNAYHDEDTYVPKEKQYKMLKAIELFYDNAYKCVKMGIPISKIRNEEIFGDLIKMKYNIPNEDISGIKVIEEKISSYYEELIEQYRK